VSERTENGAIHYHCIFDLPKLSKDKTFKNYVNYFKNSFVDYLNSNGITTINGVTYCSIGFPTRISGGVYRGSVVRSIEALSTYLTAYLMKNKSTYDSRIYAISHNCIEKSKRIEYVPQLREQKRYEYEYSTTIKYKLDKHFDDYFIKTNDKYEISASELSKKRSNKVSFNVKKMYNLQNLTEINCDFDFKYNLLLKLSQKDAEAIEKHSKKLLFDNMARVNVSEIDLFNRKNHSFRAYFCNN
jgi:hypothetical protein